MKVVITFVRGGLVKDEGGGGHPEPNIQKILFGEILNI